MSRNIAGFNLLRRTAFDVAVPGGQNHQVDEGSRGWCGQSQSGRFRLLHLGQLLVKLALGAPQVQQHHHQPNHRADFYQKEQAVEDGTAVPLPRLNRHPFGGRSRFLFQFQQVVAHRARGGRFGTRQGRWLRCRGGSARHFHHPTLLFKPLQTLPPGGVFFAVEQLLKLGDG
jgi:hypothetical protein